MSVDETKSEVHLQIALLWTCGVLTFYLGPVNVCVEILGAVDEPCLLLTDKKVH